MSFNSFIFIFLFMPIVLIIYWFLVKRGLYKGALYFLCIASVVFYSYAYLKGLPILLLSIVANYAISRGILNAKSEFSKKMILITGVLFDVALLAVFKYGMLIFTGFDGVLTAPGISFYTFTAIAFIVENYKGSIKRVDVCEYGLQMLFFPKIIQGPIVMPSDELIEGRNIKGISVEDVYRYIMLFSFGLFKKVIIADTLGRAVDYGYANPNSIHTMEALVVILSYTLQLYFDFSGYTDMAMAVAGLLGFKIPKNFDSPYKAKNIEDFWKRWHITLTKFFTRYIYIPLGGNRKGNARTFLNLLLIFFISGLWHGAGIQFIVWGMLHGVLYVIYRAFKMLKERRDASPRAVLEEKITGVSKVKNAIKILLTFIYVNIAWVFFRAPSVGAAFRLFKSVFELWFPRFNTGLAQCFNIDELWYLIKLVHMDRNPYGIYILMVVILITLLVLVFRMPNAYEYAMECKTSILNTVLIIMLLSWSILSFEGVATYLYVNF